MARFSTYNLEAVFDPTYTVLIYDAAEALAADQIKQMALSVLITGLGSSFLELDASNGPVTGLLEVNNSLEVATYLRVGSLTAPNNVTAGDITGVRLNIGNVAFPAGVEAYIGGDTLVTGYLRVGAATAPTNTTAGDLTAIRLKVADGAFVGSEILHVGGAGLVNGLLSVKQGSSTSFAKAGGVIFDFIANVSVGGAEADIFTSTTPASALGSNGDKFIASYGGNFVTVGTELTQLKVYFGGTAIWDSTGLAPATGTTSWRVYVEIIRVSATVIRYTVALNTTGASGYVYATSGELTGLTLSNTNILKITGTSSGVGSGAGDIVGKMGYVEWRPAA